MSQCLFLFTSVLLRHEATVTLVTLAQSIQMRCVISLLDSYTRKTEHVLHMHPETLHGVRGVGLPLGDGVWGVALNPPKNPG